MSILQVVAPAKATDTTHRELSWFAERVEKARHAPYVEIVTVTPTIAARLLETNDGNRPISERLVQEIAADIEHGFWQLNGETIIVSKDGLLNDGQHRLEAVIRTGQPIQTAVMFGVERSARMTIDMGKQRTAGNFLAMDGALHSNVSASASRLLLMHQHGVFNSSGRGNYQPTKQEIRQYYTRNKKALTNAISELANDKFIATGGVTPFVAAHVLLHRANAVEASVFFQRVCDGANLKAHDPILWLRSRMTLERKNKLKAPEKLEIILRHWNRWRVGSRMTRNITREGAYPEIAR